MHELPSLRMPPYSGNLGARPGCKCDGTVFFYPDHSPSQRWNDCLIKPPKETCNLRTYDCPVAGVCPRQNLCGPTQLCPPRDALQLGFDPRICFIQFDGTIII
jgi:hypothetical protein